VGMVMSDNCNKCGSPVFKMIPDKTTNQELIEFVDSSPFYSHADIQPGGLALPGIYSPNGYTQTIEIEGDGATSCLLNEEHEKALTAKLMLLAKSIDIEEFKIYLDGYIEHARKRDMNSQGYILFWVEPGDHRIVVREKEVKKCRPS